MKIVSVAVFVACLALSCTPKKQASAPPRPTCITLHYFEWSAETFRRMSCDDLRRIPDSVGIRDTLLIDSLSNALAHATRFAMPAYDDIDVRVCCLFRGARDSVIHELAFEYPPLMKIDGKVFERDQHLLEIVASFLPETYRKKMEEPR